MLVTGSSRLLGTLFCEDINISDSLVVKTLNVTDVTTNSITTSALTVNGNATTTGTLNVGNSATNGKVSLNNKVAIRDNEYSWLGINDQLAFGNGVYFGKSTVRTDGTFQVGDSGSRVLFNSSSAKFGVPVTINSSLAANNITATNVTVNDTLKAFKYDLNTIQDLGGEFCVAPTIYIQSGATVNVSKASSTTITVSILDKTAITSDSIQGVRWAQNSKIKFQGKIDGLNIRCSGIMAAKLNTTANTMSLTLTVESSIADHFATAKNGASYSDVSVMLYQRYGKKIGSTTENAYSPVGIRMSATGNANSAPYVDIWGSKSSSDPDTVYTIPSVRLGYLDGLRCGTYDCVGYGLYADNVYLNGTIISNSGTIGGFNITTNALTNGTWGTDKSVLMSTGTTENKAVGGSSAISGWCFTAGSKFGVTTSGDLYASNANISGAINATKGKIGRFDITDTYLITGIDNKCAGFGSDQAFWAGANHGDNAPFKIGYDGSFYASKGKIGGFNLSSDALYSGDKSSLDNTSDGIFISQDGQIIIGNEDNYLKYSKNSSDEYKIGLKTDYMSFSDDVILFGKKDATQSLEITANGVQITHDNTLSVYFGDEMQFYYYFFPSGSGITTIGKYGLSQHFTNNDGTTESVFQLGFTKLSESGCIPSYTLGNRNYDRYDDSGELITLTSQEKAETHGDMSLVIGEQGIASGNNSVAMAYAVASGLYAVALPNSYASGMGSFAGIGGSSLGEDSVAMGRSCNSMKSFSTTFGYNTIANIENEFVIGKYNQFLSNDNYAFVIGNGQSKKVRSNAYTVDWDGNAYYAGNVHASSFNGHTIESDIPADAKFTDTDTWRPVVDNLTSDDTDKSLSAKQGKTLKNAIDTITSSKQIGTVSCVAKANTPTATHVDFPKAFASVPIVLLSPGTAVPGTVFKGCSATNVTKTGFDLYVTRTDNGNMGVKWIAIT
nr:MAG TPA: YadA-like protein [Caudoviricetes sp.]